jgi:hypothetical protein
MACNVAVAAKVKSPKRGMMMAEIVGLVPLPPVVVYVVSQFLNSFFFSFVDTTRPPLALASDRVLWSPPAILGANLHSFIYSTNMNVI